MSAYNDQKKIFEQQVALIQGSVIMIKGRKIVPPSTLKSIIKVFYDMDSQFDEKGNLAVYLTLKKEYEKFDFEKTFFSEIPSDYVDRLDLKAEDDRKNVMETISIREFSETNFLETMYINLIIDKCGKIEELSEDPLPQTQDL